MGSIPERYDKPGQSHSDRSLIVSRPDVVMGKTGMELRGVFWKDESSAISYFAVYYDEKRKELHLELHDGPFAKNMLVAIESELGEPATRIRGEGSDTPKKLHASWSIPRNEAKVVGERIGQAFGADWAEAVESLVGLGHATLEQVGQKTWYGVQRGEIPWFPMVDLTRCDGCCKCLEFCRKDVFRLIGDPRRVEVANPLNCIVGCDLCSYKCPRGAIQFPPREILKSLHTGR